tara:strand:- start:24980 stop:25255 length:276 start_codon:yes stop_codon:yes gene_type:complete
VKVPFTIDEDTGRKELPLTFPNPMPDDYAITAMLFSEKECKSFASAKSAYAHLQSIRWNYRDSEAQPTVFRLAVSNCVEIKLDVKETIIRD